MTLTKTLPKVNCEEGQNMESREKNPMAGVQGVEISFTL